MRILMLGNAGAGKTAYLLSAFGILKKGKNGFNLRADADADPWLSLGFKALKKGGWPKPTQSRRVWPMELVCDGKTLLSFEMVDGHGGALLESGAGYVPEELALADGVMLFLDASALLKKDKKAMQLRRMIALLSIRLMEEDGDFSITVVITKYDEVGEAASFEQVCEALKPFSDNISQKKNIRFRVVPVSCGPNGFANVDYVLLDLLHGRLEKDCGRVRESLEADWKKIKYYADNKGLEDWMLSKLSGTETYKKMEKDARKEAEEKAALLKSMEEPCRRLGQYIASYKIVLPKKAPKSGFQAIFNLLKMMG